MKKLLAMSLIGCMALSMVACGFTTESDAVVATTQTETTENSGIEKTETKALQGIMNLKEIPYETSLISLIDSAPCLWYDTATHIVYIWNGNIDNYSAITPSPYYAPNGLPYKYNPETNTLYEIEP